MHKLVPELELACDRTLIVRRSWPEHRTGRSFEIRAAICGVNLLAPFRPFLGATSTLAVGFRFVIGATFSVQYGVLKVRAEWFTSTAPFQDKCRRSYVKKG